MEGRSKKVAVPKKVKAPVIKTAPLTLEAFVSGAPYETTIYKLRETLERHGVAYIPSVLTAEECAAMEDGMWSFFERLTQGWETPLRRDAPDTWPGYFKLFPMHAMLHQHWRIGHADFVWALRQNPRIVAIFAQLWGCETPEDLLVSFDGAAFHLPPEQLPRERGAYKQGGPSWFHTDQRPSDSTLLCYQSWVTARAVTPGDATLTVLQGSHAHHAEFAERFGYRTTIKEDWYKLANQAEYDFFVHEKGCQRIAICCPAGSLVLWDSRLMHAGQEPIPALRAQPNIRCIVYLCYVKRSRATVKQLVKKRTAFEEMRMTSHWPERVKLFGKQPRTYGAEPPSITQVVCEPPVLTPLGKRLAGY